MKKYQVIILKKWLSSIYSFYWLHDRLFVFIGVWLPALSFMIRSMLTFDSEYKTVVLTVV